MSFRDDVQSGKYDNSKPYPKSSSTNPLLRKTVRELTDEEIALLPGLRKKEEENLKEIQRQRDEYNKETGRLHNLFKQDLLKEYNVDPNSPMADPLFNMAWANGHSAGYGEVVSHFEELSQFYDIAIQMVKDK